MINHKVTIVTVTYNAEEILEETILSVINQSYENIEYIIIDGASTDKTVDIIKKYEDKIDYWVSESDDGIYYAMNKAIKKATGTFINFMNAGDTFADLDMVSYVMTHKSDDAELIYGNFRKKNRTKVIKALEKKEWYRNMPFCHQTLFTKTDIMKHTLFDTNFELAADHNFIVKMYQQNRVFCYIDKVIAIFAPGGFATSHQLLMNIESLKVLFSNHVEMSEIVKSEWYKSIQKQSAISTKLKRLGISLIKKFRRD